LWLQLRDYDLVFIRKKMPTIILLTNITSFIVLIIPPSMDEYLHSRPISTLHCSRQIRYHYVRILSFCFDCYGITRLSRIQVQFVHLSTTVFDWHILHFLGAKRMCRRNFQCSISYGNSALFGTTCFGCKLRTVVNYFKAHNLKIYFKKLVGAAKQHYHEPPGWGSCVQN